MTSSGIMYMTSFMKIGWPIQKLLEENWSRCAPVAPWMKPTCTQTSLAALSHTRSRTEGTDPVSWHILCPGRVLQIWNEVRYACFRKSSPQTDPFWLIVSGNWASFASVVKLRSGTARLINGVWISRYTKWRPGFKLQRGAGSHADRTWSPDNEGGTVTWTKCGIGSPTGTYVYLELPQSQVTAQDSYVRPSLLVTAPLFCNMLNIRIRNQQYFQFSRMGMETGVGLASMPRDMESICT